MARLRFLVRLANVKGFTPPDWRRVNDIANIAVHDVGGTVGATRVATKAVGLHLFVENQDQLQPALDRLAEAIGTVDDCRQLDIPTEPKPKDISVQEAKNLFNEERFWECHEILEDVWLQVGGVETVNPEGKMLQGVILVAAAFVHHQRADDVAALVVLQRALKKLGAWPEDIYLSLNIKTLREQVQRILETKQISEFRLD